MKIYNTQAEIERDIKDGELYVADDVKFNCSFKIAASIWVNGDIVAYNISAHDIIAHDISAYNISADGKISFYAFCIAACSIKCKSIAGRRENSIYKCLDGNLEIIPASPSLSGKKVSVTVDGKTYTATID
jgi:hypothetical protein